MTFVEEQRVVHFLKSKSAAAPTFPGGARRSFGQLDPEAIVATLAARLCGRIAEVAQDELAPTFLCVGVLLHGVELRKVGGETASLRRPVYAEEFERMLGPGQTAPRFRVVPNEKLSCLETFEQ
jgi:hypothetical protein